MTDTKDNIQSLDIIDDRDLNAYVDGLLDDRRARKVEEYLKRHPEKAAEVQDYIEYDRLLRKACEDETDESVPQRLLTVLARPVRNIWPAAGKVAAVFALCALSAGGGWMGAYQSGGVASRDDGMGNFLHQVVLNGEPDSEAMPVRKREVDTGSQADPLNWLTQKVALEIQPPNLTQAGYALAWRRLVTRGPQEFVELEYTSSSGEAIRLHMSTRWEQDATPIEFAQQEDRSIAYWQEGPLAYALSGPLDRRLAMKIAEMVRASRTDVPSEPPQVQDVQDVQVMAPQPVQQPQTNYGTPSIAPTDPLSPTKLNALDGQY